MGEDSADLSLAALLLPVVGSSGAVHALIAHGGVDLGNITARKLNDGRTPLIGSVGSDQNLYARGFGLGKGIRDVSDFIAGRLAPIGVWKVTIRYENG